MNYEKLIKKHEGIRLKPYKDTEGILTIGVGRNLEDNGISEDEANYLLNNDIKHSIADVRSVIPEFDGLPENVKLVLVDMMFNLGINRFRLFKKMIAAVKSNNWPEMIAEMKDSKWCRELTSRCEDNAALIKAII